MKKNDIIELDIVSVSTDGAGIGKHEGVAVFVPLSAVGDRLKVRIIKVNKSYLVGKIEEIIVPGAGRIPPDCPVFRQCGGCMLRHIDYETECRYKKGYVENNIRKLGGMNIAIEDTVPADNTIGYRNKAIYPVAPDENGKPVYGFYSAHSHRIVPIKRCLIGPEIFDKIAAFTVGFCEKNGISPYCEEAGTGVLRNIYLRISKKGDVCLCLIVNDDFPATDLFIKEAVSEFPEIKTVVINKNTTRGNVLLGKNYKTVYGNGYIEDELCGLRFRISAASFYQVNRDTAEKLYGIAAELASPKSTDTLIDMYCGAGTIGLSMARRVKRLIGVEIVPEAVENAKENAAVNGIENASFICADAKDGANEIIKAGIKPDIIVVDPPRKGCDSETLSAINRLSPEKLVYISCNSATLARDMSILQKFGYTAGKVVPVDMFPRTPHVESVVLLSRA